jgi:uncharacterized protein YbjT (DUF2867 family)
MITITTPTGNIGRRLIERLVAAGKPLTIVARHPEKLPRFLREREIVRQASSDDAAALSRATEGTDVLFWLTPPNFASPNVRAWYRKAADAVSRAVTINRIPRIVNLSSIGANWAEGLGPISGLHDVERALNDAADDVFHLRPGFFMENFLAQLDSIRRDGKLYWLYPGHARFPMIATRDIAEEAAARLVDHTWKGHRILGLLSPTDLTLDEAVKTLALIVGRPMRNVQLTPDEFRRVSQGSGMSPDFAENYIEMFETLNRQGWTPLGEPRTPETTTTTTLGTWASQVLIPLVKVA